MDLRAIPHIEQYNDLWAMHEPYLRRIESIVQDRHRLELHMAEQSLRIVKEAEPKDPYAFEVVDGIARMPIKGMMTKYGSSFAGEYVGNLRLQRMVRNAASDDRVHGVLFLVESGGGSTMGVDDLATEVATLRGKKPTATVFTEIGASAAYYVGSQTGMLFAHPSAFVGGIGTYGVIEDWSKVYDAAGVKVHVVRAGQFKGMGTRGTEISESQLAEIQRNINAINELFLAAVMRGRGWNREETEALADGRVHIAAEARNFGVIDAVGTESDAIAWMRSQVQAVGGPRGAAHSKGKIMSEANGNHASAAGTATAPAEPRAATLKELKKAFPRAGDAFYVACLDDEMTMEQSREAYTAKVETDLAEARAENERLKAEAAKAAAKSPAKAAPAADKGGAGVDPVAEETIAKDAAGDPITAFNKAVDEELAKCKNRSVAVSRVVAAQPELHAAYLESINTRRRK